MIGPFIDLVCRQLREKRFEIPEPAALPVAAGVSLAPEASSVGEGYAG
jgi:hypothetical protein